MEEHNLTKIHGLGLEKMVFNGKSFEEIKRNSDYCLNAINAHDDLLAACEQAAAFLLQIGYCGGGAAAGAVLERAIAQAKGGA